MSTFISSAMTRFLDAKASQVARSNEPKTPGAGQHEAPFISRRFMPNSAITFFEAISIPGYLFGVIHPRKNA